MATRQSRALNPALQRALGEVPKEPREMLCERWTDLYGKPPPKNMPRILLELGIAYRLQEKVLGGHSVEVRKRLAELAEPKRATTTAPGLRTGTTLVRTWRATTHSVTVLEKGFVYKGRTYGSLTQIAKVITGTHQSGPNFFGLRGERGVVRG